MSEPGHLCEKCGRIWVLSCFGTFYEWKYVDDSDRLPKSRIDGDFK